MRSEKRPTGFDRRGCERWILVKATDCRREATSIGGDLDLPAVACAETTDGLGRRHHGHTARPRLEDLDSNAGRDSEGDGQDGSRWEGGAAVGGGSMPGYPSP